MTSQNILGDVVRLSFGHSTYFQWIPSHIQLNGNEIADSLVAKSAIADVLRRDACLTFPGHLSIKMMELNALWRVPPDQPWYFGKNFVCVTNLILLG
ncbi:hypothetical protein TNCV_3210101 [Trichonephila clavipes]|nr:hypothetical protein TNCV_3210101 [Trichonephila clavipes]